MAIKQRPDSPTNNFATLNRLHANLINTSLQEGNLKWVKSSSNAFAIAYGSIGVSSGKYYYELDVSAYTLYFSVGFFNGSSGPFADADTDRVSYQLYTGAISKAVDGTSSSVATGKETSTGIIGVAIDCDNGEVSMYHNNTLQATATGLRTNQTYFPRIYVDGNNSSTAYFNFGQDPTFGGNKNTPATVNINGTNVTGPFAPSGDAAGTSGLFYYPPPAGAKALCTANLPEMTPTVNDDVPKDYFKAVTWTGQTTGGAYDHATGKVTTSMAPDLVWIKSRSSSYSNNINDSVRGVGRFLMSNIAVDEVNSSDGYNTNSTADANTILRSFDADGFNVGNNVNVNDPSNNMVAWCWKAGGAPDLTSSPTKPFAKNGVQHETLSAANITAGTITPTAMSVNTDAGFSIVKYGGSNTTGLLSSSVSSATIPHGLNDCEFCIIKNLKWSNTWVVSHRSIAPNVMSLQDTGIAGSTPPVDPAYGQITTLGSNTVTITRGSIRGDNVGEDFDAGGGQFEYIMYCWHSVEGYSKFGSYTGNEDPDGPFVYCGFRPAWVMVKRTDSANSWFILDNARNFYNSIDEYLAADDPAGEGTAANIADFVSNGVKIRGGSGYFGFNASGGTYIYMAFAEQPFNYANAR